MWEVLLEDPLPFHMCGLQKCQVHFPVPTWAPLLSLCESRQNSVYTWHPLLGYPDWKMEMMPTCHLLPIAWPFNHETRSMLCLAVLHDAFSVTQSQVFSFQKSWILVQLTPPRECCFYSLDWLEAPSALKPFC